MNQVRHQFINRKTGEVETERLFGDRTVCFIYSKLREKAPFLFRALVTPRVSGFLGKLNYDFPISGNIRLIRKYLKLMNIDETECYEPLSRLHSARKIFERKIRYWEKRPMPIAQGLVVSPSDSRIIIGSFCERDFIFAKEKFFSVEELLGTGKLDVYPHFREGDYSIFRLTPEKYHFNHFPVTGRILDFYELNGIHHSCNPSALVIASPLAKNKRAVTIIDTDVDGGDGVGLVAMIEIVALMIGDIVQCYSKNFYYNPRPMEKGMFVYRGAPKSLFRPGSSTVVLIFEPNRIEFAEDLVENRLRKGVESRFSLGLGRPLIETDIMVRDPIAKAICPLPT